MLSSYFKESDICLTFNFLEDFDYETSEVIVNHYCLHINRVNSKLHRKAFEIVKPDLNEEKLRNCFIKKLKEFGEGFEIYMFPKAYNLYLSELEEIVVYIDISKLSNECRSLYRISQDALVEIFVKNISEAITNDILIKKE